MIDWAFTIIIYFLFFTKLLSKGTAFVKLRLTTAQTQHKVERGLLLNVVIG
jgi:hypothetical protein